MNSLEWFRIVIPDAKDITDAQVNNYLAVAVVGECPEPWGNVFGLAMAWKAGHFFQSNPVDADGNALGGAGAGGTAGAVSSKRTGDVSVSFGSAISGFTGGSGDLEGADISLATTVAGREYLALRKRLCIETPLHVNLAAVAAAHGVALVA